MSKALRASKSCVIVFWLRKKEHQEKRGSRAVGEEMVVIVKIKLLQVLVTTVTRSALKSRP